MRADLCYIENKDFRFEVTLSDERGLCVCQCQSRYSIYSGDYLYKLVSELNVLGGRGRKENVRNEELHIKTW